MSVVDLMARLNNSGISVRVVKRQLKINYKKGRLKKKLLNEIREQKENIIAFLESTRNNSRFTAIQAAPKKEYYKLSSAQKRLYILQQLDKDRTNYNMPHMIPLDREIEIKKLEGIFKEIIYRHDSLRTSFVMVDEEPVQRIHKDVDFAIEKYSTLSETLGEKIKRFTRPFDLSLAPLLRVGIIETELSNPMLLFDLHHIITDATSQAILEREFVSFYKGEKLPLMSLQYKDYAEWQQHRKQKGIVKRHETYWLNKFSDELPVLNLPTDYPRPLVKSFAGSAVCFIVSRQNTAALKNLSRDNDGTLYISLLAVFTILLSKIAGQDDIIVGTMTSGRRHIDLVNIIGMFVNTLCMRNQTPGEKSFKEFLKDVRWCTLEAYENQEYQFEDLVGKVAVRRDISRNPIFDAALNFLQQIEYKGDISKLKSEAEYLIVDTDSKFDLTLGCVESRDMLLFSLEYYTEIFEKETIKRFIGYLRNIITSVTVDPWQKISEIEIICEDEKNWILYDINNTEEKYPMGKTVRQLFEEQVGKTPECAALCFEGAILSYSILNDQANRLAARLREKGVRQGIISGLLVERSLEMIIAIIGILKAGGAYLPIDPRYPSRRIRYILADCAADILLTHKRYATCAPGFLETLDIDEPLLNDHIADSKESAVNRLDAADPAYIIYTSGSTGLPKGIVIENRSILNTLFALQQKYPFSQSDIYLLKTAYVFDVSLAEIFGWFLGGGKLAILEKGGEREPAKILSAVARFNVSHINFIPSMFNTFVELLNKDNIGQLTCLRYIFLAGEALQPPAIEKFRQKMEVGTLNMENIYGPTEASIYGSWYSLSDWSGGRCIPIGNPLYNVKLYILDKFSHLQPPGIPGELYISGAGLARGYLNNPGLTEERFSANPFIAGQRIFKTGDMVKWQPGGNIDFLGRVDYQVKIRGFRIELGEIESRLLSHKNIKDAVVLAREGKTGGKYLCAYIVADIDLLVPEIREYLKDSLPDYMIPSFFYLLTEIPLTPNGKVDRNRLDEMQGKELNRGVTYVTARNESEQTLVNIWQEVLGREGIGTKDNFFVLGGDSIKTIQIAAKLRKIGCKIEMKDIFINPTISELAKKIRKSGRIPDQSIVTGTVPLTPIQAEFFSQKKVNPHHFNQSIMLFSNQGFDIKAIEAVLKKLLEHHDALRMVFIPAGEEVRQMNNGAGYPLSLRVYNLKGERDALRILDEKVNEIQASIKLETGPLMQTGLFDLDDGSRLLIVIHHLVIDTVSWRILFEDIETLYRQYKEHKEFELPLKSDSFKLWSEKLSQYADSEKFIKEKTYWAGIESTDVECIEKDFKSTNRIEDIAAHSFSLSEEETNMLLTGVNHAFGTEINDILLTGLGLALAETFGQQKVLIALEGHGREEIIEDMDISRTVGWFTSRYPVVIDMSYRNDLSRQIKEVKETLHRIPMKGIGYGVLKYLTARRHKPNLEFNLVPQICFNYLGQFDTDVGGKSFSIAKESSGHSISPKNEREYELDISGFVTKNGLTLSITYGKNRFKSQRIKKLSDSYKNLLLRIIAHCKTRSERELTPSDLTYGELTLDEFGAIGELLKK